MYNVFYSVLPMFLIAFLGNVIRRNWLMSDEFWRGLEKLSFYVLFPTVLFKYSMAIDLHSSEFFYLIFALVFANLVVSGGLIAYQATYKPYSRVQFTSVFQGATRYNNYVFFGIGSALFGGEGLTAVVAISPYLLILTNITSILSFSYYVPRGEGISKRQSFLLIIKSVFANPFVLSSVLGIVCNYFNVELNLGVAKTIDNLSNSALTIGMLIVGAGIKIKIKSEHFKQIAFTSLVKLVIMPIVTFITIWLMGITGTAKSVGIVFSCLPCASSSYILSRQLGGDPETMASIITFTTIFSIFTLSLLVYILG
jgi:hypothetical protein